MDLKDAIDWPSDQNQGGGMWPAPPNNQVWPGPNPQPHNPMWEGGNSGGGIWGGQKDTSGPSATNLNINVPVAPQNLVVPYKEVISHGMHGKTIIIRGVVKPNPDKLTVDFSAGQELVFHFNPRFKDESDGKVIVMNSRLGMRWGHEERERQQFPFIDGQPFEMKIRCTSEGFMVQVGNCNLPVYKHRTNPRSVDTITIYNDLILTGVNIDER